jgi:hypothetical protein
MANDRAAMVVNGRSPPRHLRRLAGGITFKYSFGL